MADAETAASPITARCSASSRVAKTDGDAAGLNEQPRLPTYPKPATPA